MSLLSNVTHVKARYFVILAAFLSSLISGCATMEGAGEDIQSAGEAVEEGAQDASN